MNSKQKEDNWKNIPHLKIGEIPPSVIDGSINVTSLLVAKRLLLATNEDAEKEPEQTMEDVVANIMMLCCHLGIDFESVLNSARDAHRGETNLVEIVPKAVFDARPMPGHYHLEFAGDEDFDGDPVDDETRYFNATLEECIQKIGETDKVLLKAYFVCQFGCGQEHALSDNERVLLGLRPLSVGVTFWGGSLKDVARNFVDVLKDADRPK